VTNTYNASTGNLWVRENTATTFSGAGTSQSPALFCNPGGITLPNQVENPTEEGAAAPNPSNIFVNNLPGTISSVEVELEQFQNTTAVDTITATASLLVGPGATSSNSLNFFTGTGAPDNSTVLSLGNYYFSDSGSEPVPESNYGPGIYQPASYSLVQVHSESERLLYASRFIRLCPASRSRIHIRRFIQYDQSEWYLEPVFQPVHFHR
jgi:hypothetical protein